MERFGRYLLLDCVGMGGMAQVYRAVTLGEAGFNKTVAVKRITPQMAADARYVGMLVDEAKIAATLSHPNIVAVQDLGTEAGLYFMAMDYVAGQSLSHILKRCLQVQLRLEPALAFHIVEQALRGLAHAHKKRDSEGRPMDIIHRDVSPQNILVGYDGTVKLADFGIARATQRSTETVTGTLKGKPGYVAPEQLHGQTDQRSDIYAMGVVLHECLSMRRMRRGNSDMEMLAGAMMGTIPPLESLGGAVTDEAAAVVYRALAKEPSERWQTAEEFADATTALQRQSGWNHGMGSLAAVMEALFPEEIRAEGEHATRAQRAVRAAMDPNISAEERDAVFKELAAVRPPTGVFQTPLSTPSFGAGPTRNPRGSNPSLTPLAGTPGLGRTIPPPPSFTSSHTPTGERLNVDAAFMDATIRASAPQPTSRTPLFAGLSVAALLLVGGGAWFATRPSLGSLVIESEPPGAAVRLDGRELGKVTPAVAAGLAAGPVEVEVLLAGRQPAKRVVKVLPGDTATVRMELAALDVSVEVASDPPGAAVTADGVELGRTPLNVPFKGRATLAVTLALAGHETVRKELVASENATPFRAVLAPLPVEKAAPPPAQPAAPAAHAAAPSGGGGAKTGHIGLQSRPWGRIKIDGKDTGRFTPAMDITLTSGSHKVTIRNDEEGVEDTFNVVVKPGTKVEVFARELR